MNGHRYPALQFVHPDFDVVEGQPGLQVSPTGALATVEDEMLVRQSILLLLSTAPGERVMRPDYGCDLRKLVFEPNDDTTAGLAIHYVRQALERWEPRVEILRLDAGPHRVSLSPDEIDRQKKASPGAKTRPASGDSGGSSRVSADEADAARLIMELEYRVRATRHVERLTVSINLSGEEI